METEATIQVSDSPGSICAFHLRKDIPAMAVAECMIMPVEDAPVWWISRVLVPEKIGRSKGLGSRLLQVMIERCRRQESELRIVVAPGGYTADNARQIAFYERNGFVKGNSGIFQGLYVYNPKPEPSA